MTQTLRVEGVRRVVGLGKANPQGGNWITYATTIMVVVAVATAETWWEACGPWMRRESGEDSPLGGVHPLAGHKEGGRDVMIPFGGSHHGIYSVRLADIGSLWDGEDPPRGGVHPPERNSEYESDR